MNDVVIVSACRTPIGSFGGSLRSLTAPQLGAIAIEEAIRRAGVAKEHIDEVIMGNVVQAGVGQAPARQAALGAGVPPAVQTMTVNKVCGSGLKAIMLGAQAIALGDAEIVVAGGMESMSNAPFLVPGARFGYKYGNAEFQDALVRDGLQDVYQGVPMGTFADECAASCGVPREAQDEFTVLSYKRAQESIATGRFREEIVKVPIPGKKGEVSYVETDEEPPKAIFEKIPTLRPAFTKDGTVTAASSSKINDGAAALLLMSSSKASALKLTPMARIVSSASAAKSPNLFPVAPADVIPKVLSKAGLSVSDIDLFEINEAFAVVPLAVGKIAGIGTEKINVNGGAVALGHPIGASGARITVTLLYAMRQRNAKRGMAAICIGGGEASGMIVEMA